MRGRIIALYGVLGAGNVLAWIWAWTAFHGDAVLLGTALLAYTFGLRHAVDADHIAAIDNVTRKLMQDGQRPVAVGFYFSLGHSAVVALAAAAVALTAGALQLRFAAFRSVGGLIGTGVSVAFLFAMAIVNLFVLAAVYRRFRAMRRGWRFSGAELDDDLDRRGILARFCRPLFRLMHRSWHMAPLGFLFGLGFETASEIALLGIAANAAKGLPIGSTMVFPALFAAGMMLIDSTDSVLMVGAYGWAFVKPIRKLYYNLVITGVSVVVALVVGGVEALGLVGNRFSLGGPFWAYVASVNDNFGRLGYLIIAIFIASWALSALIYRLKGYDDLDMADGSVVVPVQDFAAIGAKAGTIGLVVEELAHALLASLLGIEEAHLVELGEKIILGIVPAQIADALAGMLAGAQRRRILRQQDLGEFGHPLLQARQRHGLVDEPDRRRFPAVERLAGHGVVEEIAPAEDRRRRLQHVAGGNDAPIDLRQAEIRFLGGDCQVAGDHRIERPAEAPAIDHCNGRLEEIAEPAPLPRRAGTGEDGPLLHRQRIAGAKELAQIHAARIGVARPGQHQHADPIVGLERIEHLQHFLAQFGIDGVALFRPVERHPGDAVRDLDENGLASRQRLVGHLILPLAAALTRAQHSIFASRRIIERPRECH